MAMQINPDLLKERDKCSFDVVELTNFLDGGADNTLMRKRLEDLVLKCPDIRDEVPEEYLSHKERYENGVRKSVMLYKLLQKSRQDGTSAMDTSKALFHTMVGQAVLPDNSPFSLHFSMFIPAINGNGTPEQQKYWLKRAQNMEILGTYAQTELGHGTFIRGLETTATYDPKNKQFVLHSPTLSSYKWWPGGMGHTANYCVVMAQLYTKGKSCGIQPFMVQLRDEETHTPLPGIMIGEIGAKLGFNTVNNGFLGFDNHRISFDRMLMKNAKVLEDGTFVPSPNSRLTYGTMIYVRVMIVNSMANILAKVATIAVRYSAVRHQSQPKSNEPEPQILDYYTQQHKLFITIAFSHAFRLTANWLWRIYNNCNEKLNLGNMDSLPELHALACCLKALSSAETTSSVERCRLACGGHGYMQSSNLPFTYGLATAACTYEGENTVLMLQTARFLAKAWEQFSLKKKVTSTVSYFALKSNSLPLWENSTESIIKGFQIVALGKVKCCVETIEKRIKSGMSYEDAWNMTSIQLVSAAEAHCRAIVLSTYKDEISRLSTNLSVSLQKVLMVLVDLSAAYWALEKIGDLLLYVSISERDVQLLQNRYEELLAIVRPDAVGLVDAFDLRDEILRSTLGAYDGRVYERLMEEALKSPLNTEPVNQSFHKYLKPFMQGKL